MGIKTGAGGMNILGRDVGRSDTKLGRMAQTLAKAKSTGSGIGGLLGGIIGQILIPIPGVGAAIGAGLGSLAGSKVGGATSGVNQSDILASKFRKESAHNITKQVAQQEFSNVAKSTLSGFMQGINPASSMSKFGSGFKTGAGMGLPAGIANPADTMGSQFMGGMKGGFKAIMPKMPTLGAGDVMGDATMTDIPGLPESPGPWANAPEYSGSSNPSSLLDMGAQGDVPNYTAPQSPEDVSSNAMSSLGINLPGLDDMGDWEMGEDGREWSPSLGKYKDEMREYR
jgi:hypothetical protein